MKIIQLPNNIFDRLGLHTTNICAIQCDSLMQIFCFCVFALCTMLWMIAQITFLLLGLFIFLFSSSETLQFILCLSALSHIHLCSSFSCCDGSLVFELCVFCAMICSVVSLLLPGLSLSSSSSSSFSTLEAQRL